MLENIYIYWITLLVLRGKTGMQTFFKLVQQYQFGHSSLRNHVLYGIDF